MKVNYKQVYGVLSQQVKALRHQLHPVEGETVVNEIPSNFNQIGWDLTIEKAELMVEKLKKLRDNKGKRLTPQFYRSIFNRALIAIGEADKLLESFTAETKEIDYEAEVLKLNAEFVELQNELLANKAAAETPAQ